MRIDLHNYEAFFLDYKEGSLDSEQERKLFAFLEEHPELRAELESFEELVLEPEFTFENKASLKKSDVNNEMLIAYTENLIDKQAKNEIETLASQNNVLAKELKFYTNTVLVADALVKYPNKARLKRGGVVIYLQSDPVYLRVAAAVLLLLGLFFLVSKFTSNDTSGNAKPVLANESKIKTNTLGENKKAVILPNEEVKHLAANNSVKNERSLHPFNHNSTKLAKSDQPGKENNVPSITNTPSVNSNTVIAINNNKAIYIDSITDAMAANKSAISNNEATYNSYYNYSREEDEEKLVTASVTPAKKTFFQRVANAAKKVNEFGVRKVNGEEEQGKNSLNIGGLVVSESLSN